MFIRPPYMGSQLKSRLKNGSNRVRNGVSDLEAAATWAAMIAIGLVVAAVLAWWLSA